MCLCPRICVIIVYHRKPWRWRNAVSYKPLVTTYNKITKCTLTTGVIVLTSNDEYTVFGGANPKHDRCQNSSECCDPMRSKLSPNSPGCCPLPLPLPGSGALKHYKVIRSDDTRARGGPRKLWTNAPNIIWS